jgi:hypothetical protein
MSIRSEPPAIASSAQRQHGAMEHSVCSVDLDTVRPTRGLRFKRTPSFIGRLGARGSEGQASGVMLLFVMCAMALT